MRSKLTTPLDAFETSVKASGILWNAWQQILSDHQKRQEAELQRALIDPKGHTEDQRMLPRINRISAATRAFLDQNSVLTFWSFIPVVRESELSMARNFVQAFQKTDHDLRLQAGVPLEEWCRPQSFRDELGKVVGRDDTTYQIVAWLPTVPKKARGPAIQHLCGQLTQEHEQHQRQME